MLEAIVWGLLQGLTEFLPVSSSGHLRVVPDLFGLSPPDLATSAVLHLGTLVAVITYYRSDIVWMARGIRRDPLARRTVLMVVVATIPAVVVGAAVVDAVERFQESVTAVGIALIGTGAVLLVSKFLPMRTRRAEEVGVRDAVGMGAAQALALLPGVSRSGMVITTGIARGLSGREAARFGFLMAIPVTLGAAAREAITVAGSGTLGPELVIGTLVAAVSGYGAISLLIKALARYGLWPFAVYCLAAGSFTLIRL